MAYSTTFFLKEPESKKDTLVMMSFTYNYIAYSEGKKQYGRVRYSTGEKINPDFWNFENQQSKQTDKFPYREFNTRLRKFKNAVEDIYRRFLNDNQRPNPAMIKVELDIRFGRDTRKPIDNLFSFIDRYINTARLTDRGKPISPLTLKKYRTTYNTLKDFAAYRGGDFDFSDIDKQLYEDFLVYLQSKKRFSLNTCGKVITNFKFFLNRAIDEGIKFDDKIMSKFTAPWEFTDKVYLTTDEIIKLHRLNLGSSTISRMKDLFVCACCTGLRYSDLNALKKENIYTDGEYTFLKVNTYKTGETVVIPIHPIVKEIFEYRGGYLSPAISNQAMNRLIKEMCRKAGITQKVSIVKNIAGKRVTSTVEKCEEVTSHTARRSFATNAFLSGVPAHAIMKLTGHKTEKSFLAYLRMDNEQNARLIANSDFFKANLRVV